MQKYFRAYFLSFLRITLQKKKILFFSHHQWMRLVKSFHPYIQICCSPLGLTVNYFFACPHRMSNTAVIQHNDIHTRIFGGCMAIQLVTRVAKRGVSTTSWQRSSFLKRERMAQSLSREMEALALQMLTGYFLGEIYHRSGQRRAFVGCLTNY